MLPSTDNVQTIVGDRSLAQLSLLQTAYLQAEVDFCRFSVPIKVCRRCSSLSVPLQTDSRRIHRWMRNLVFALTKEEVNNVKAAIATGCPAAMT